MKHWNFPYPNKSDHLAFSSSNNITCTDSLMEKITDRLVQDKNLIYFVYPLKQNTLIIFTNDVGSLEPNLTIFYDIIMYCFVTIMSWFINL